MISKKRLNVTCSVEQREAQVINDIIIPNFNIIWINFFEIFAQFLLQTMIFM
jgi:hypothetical protein